MTATTEKDPYIEEQRSWLMAHRKTSGASWNEVAKRVGIPFGTLSQFGSEKGYNGDELRVAEAVERYRQVLTAQARIAVEAPPIPSYFETGTSRELCYLLNWGQQGEFVVAALAPGLGKSETAAYYSNVYANVAVAEMSAAIQSAGDMLIVILRALGVENAKGTTLNLAMQVQEKLASKGNPLLIIDETQHLTSKMIDLIRSWNDKVGAGIALFGDEHLLQRLEGDASKLGLAQLYSRIGFRLVRTAPLAEDVDALAKAWNVEDAKVLSTLRSICSRRGCLRSGTKALRLAKMMAQAQDKPLDATHLQDAWAQLSSRAIAA